MHLPYPILCPHHESQPSCIFLALFVFHYLSIVVDFMSITIALQDFVNHRLIKWLGRFCSPIRFFDSLLNNGTKHHEQCNCFELYTVSDNLNCIFYFIDGSHYCQYVIYSRLWHVTGAMHSACDSMVQDKTENVASTLDPLLHSQTQGWRTQ